MLHAFNMSDILFGIMKNHSERICILGKRSIEMVPKLHFSIF